MLKLGKLTDYAVVALTRMAQEPDTVHTAPRLAEVTGVPAPTVAKLLKLLAHAEVLVSQRGASGGYRLSRAPEAISVAEIIAAMEGPIALTACIDGGEGNCGVESLCPMRSNWEKVNRAVRTALEAVSLADMMPVFPFAPTEAPAARRVAV